MASQQQHNSGSSSSSSSSSSADEAIDGCPTSTSTHSSACLTSSGKESSSSSFVSTKVKLFLFCSSLGGSSSSRGRELQELFRPHTSAAWSWAGPYGLPQQQQE
ncbi:hypothetical protein Emag_002042 [Eimeria magna]